MAKPVLKFKVNAQSAEVGGKLYGIIEDVPVTPENSILQICELMKITAFSPTQVLRLIEDVCQGAALLVQRDGQSRQISSLLKFSARVRGTFASIDARWTDQELIVGARLLKDIKLKLNPADYTMSNVADTGLLQSAAWAWSGGLEPPMPIGPSVQIAPGSPLKVRINGSRLGGWSAADTFVAFWVETLGADGVPVRHYHDADKFALVSLSEFADNGFTATLTPTEVMAFGEYFDGFEDTSSAVGVEVYHPDSGALLKSLNLRNTNAE